MEHHRFSHIIISVLAAISLASISFAKPTTTVQAQSYNDRTLSSLTFHHQEIVTVDQNHPRFSKSSESEKHGPWQKFSNLDFLNRAHTANALLNEKIMPTAKRQALTWNPTGWHNRRIQGGWLFNRCHLIGYQLTGQNNNPRNLITGTRELNDPNMLKYENEVANYIKKSAHNYLRYRVTPIYRGNNLLANGVEMEGQSVGSNAVHFNIYIFNEQPGVKLNYRNGTSKISKQYVKIKRTVKKHKRYIARRRKRITKHLVNTKNHRIIGNRRSKIYHVANGRNYHISAKNVVYFNSEAAAKRAGYRKSKR